MVRSRVRELKNMLTSYDEDFDIIEETYQMLTPPGEHYGSIMLALDVTLKCCTGNQKSLNLVAKLTPASELLKKSFNIQNTFKKEVFAYQNVIPALSKLQRDFNVPEENIIHIFPKCYGARITLKPNKNEVDEDAAIIFENLKPQGYAMEDRLIGFDYDHACLILKNMAKLHSTSLALRLLKPDFFKQEIEPHIVSDIEPTEISKPFIECIYKHSAKCKELEDYIERLNIFVETSLYNLKNPISRRHSIFETIVHQDFWVNNILILRNNIGKPLKTKIVDLQLISYDSLAYDIILFLLTSVINSVLDQHYFSLIQVYHCEFINNLEYFKIELKPYTLLDLLHEIELVAPRAVFDALIMLKPIFTERGKIKSTLEDFDESDWKREDLLGDSYTNKLKDTVLSIANRNWL